MTNRRVQIKILDAIECEVSKADGMRIAPCLSFDAVYWVQGPYKKIRKQYKKQVFSFKGKTVWRFYAGLLPRVVKWCNNNNIRTNIVGTELKIATQSKPNLAGIKFRSDQLGLINSACDAQRGIIQSPTGTGKTIMQLGILSCYPKQRALILAHTTAIVRQTYENLKRFGFKSVEMFGGGNKAQEPTKRITVSTMQSFLKIDPKYYMDYYDIVIVDESHHIQKQGSTYSKILSNMLAPIRLGFTATVRTTGEAVLVNEGLLGPIIDKVTIQEAADIGVLAEPKLKLIKAQCNQKIMNLRKYQDVYSYGIVENKQRNRQIAELAREFYKQKKITLIFVVHIKHGELLVDEIKNLFGYKTPFIQGSLPPKEREKIKAGLIKGRIKLCIATVSWREGVDIPNLDAVVITSGGKSEIQTLQGVGRGLRRTKNKSSVTIVDFLDLTHTLLIRQTGERLSIYSDMGWL